MWRYQNEEDVMIYNNRRHSCGSFTPNAFFLLQLVGIGLLIHISTEIFSSGPPFIYLVAAAVLVTVLNCMDKRRKVIERQGNCRTF